MKRDIKHRLGEALKSRARFGLFLKIKCLENNAGFFPINQDNIIKYMERMLYDTHYIDLLGSFCRNEVYLKEELKHIKKVHIKDIEPFYGTTPWFIFKGPSLGDERRLRLSPSPF